MVEFTVVPDTNILLHHSTRIPWLTLLQASAVEIVLVPQVLRELDAKKYADSDKLRKRAQRVFTEIHRWIPLGTTTNTIATGVTLTLLPREPAARDGLDLTVADDRIVASAVGMANSNRELRLVTADIGMRIKAEAQGLTVFMPETNRLTDHTERKQQPKSARVTAGISADDSSSLGVNVTVAPGLSAAHLLPDAYDSLAHAQRRESSGAGDIDLASIAGIGIPGWPHREKPPSASAFEQYIESIIKYDRDNANVAELIRGVENDGDAPAEDIVVDFVFPEAMHVVQHEPQYPTKPRTRTGLDFLGHTLRAIPPHPLEINQTFRFHYNDTYRPVATVNCRRLMQKDRVAYAVWVHVNAASSGFPIALRLRVGSPPTTVDRQLNVRIERGR